MQYGETRESAIVCSFGRPLISCFVIKRYMFFFYCSPGTLPFIILIIRSSLTLTLLEYFAQRIYNNNNSSSNNNNNKNKQFIYNQTSLHNQTTYRGLARFQILILTSREWVMNSFKNGKRTDPFMKCGVRFKHKSIPFLCVSSVLLFSNWLDDNSKL